MAHFAEIDSNNKVLRVIVVPDEHESNGSEWCHDLLGGNWVQTSYNNNIRKIFAGVDFTYDPIRDEFVEPQPFPSWVLDEENNWNAPSPRPSNWHYWNEESLSWVQHSVLNPEN